MAPRAREVQGEKREAKTLTNCRIRGGVLLALGHGVASDQPRSRTGFADHLPPFPSDERQHSACELGHLLHHRSPPREGTSASWPMCKRARSETVDRVEIRVVLDTIDPPAGHLQVTANSGPARAGSGRACDEMSEVSFTGWLDLLRALYLVTGSD
jgi:hypothetical protein